MANYRTETRVRKYGSLWVSNLATPTPGLVWRTQYVRGEGRDDVRNEENP